MSTETCRGFGTLFGRRTVPRPRHDLAGIWPGFGRDLAGIWTGGRAKRLRERRMWIASDCGRPSGATDRPGQRNLHDRVEPSSHWRVVARGVLPRTRRSSRPGAGGALRYGMHGPMGPDRAERTASAAVAKDFPLQPPNRRPTAAQA
ncbi:hypothetical protein FRAAL3057 [Frankia alni ACN14a]|uniref:Uncharacterized protein n=1 Tax=Frankia alni (strain DSM 45986 / CECT 9034 / ACN14a) TaxID=326424 RepID=Q0RLA4_FRAAA|nr:hypothetical protein FRAAL3057 [Frankia alni ACN14a]